MPLSSSSAHSWIFRWRGYLGVLLLAPAALLAVLSGRHWEEGTRLDLITDGIAVLLILAGLMLRTWATVYIAGHKTKDLIVRGPYAVCRNPLYLGSLLIGLGIASFLQSLTFAGALLLAWVLVYLPVIRSEEVALRSRHGGEYDAYRSRVPRLFPERLRLFAESEPVAVSLIGLRNHLRRSMLVLALIPLGETMAYLQTSGAIPQWFHLP